MVRMGFVQNGAPGTAPDGTSFVNPVVGGTYALKIGGSFRLAAFLGVTIPIGMGGGSTPDPAAVGRNIRGHRRALRNGQRHVRSQLHDRLPGRRLRLRRAQADRAGGGDPVPAVPGQRQTTRPGSRPTATRTNSTMGIHAGYFVLPDVVARRRDALPALAVDADPHRDGRQVRLPSGEHGHGQLRDRTALPLQGRLAPGCAPGSRTRRCSTSRSAPRTTRSCRSTCPSCSDPGAVPAPRNQVGCGREQADSTSWYQVGCGREEADATSAIKSGVAARRRMQLRGHLSVARSSSFGTARRAVRRRSASTA